MFWWGKPIRGEQGRRCHADFQDFDSVQRRIHQRIVKNSVHVAWTLPSPLQLHLSILLPNDIEKVLSEHPAANEMGNQVVVPHLAPSGYSHILTACPKAVTDNINPIILFESH